MVVLSYIFAVLLVGGVALVCWGIGAILREADLSGEEFAWLLFFVAVLMLALWKLSGLLLPLLHQL